MRSAKGAATLIFLGNAVMKKLAACQALWAERRENDPTLVVGDELGTSRLEKKEWKFRTAIET